ncbi:MAG: hypothetical protein M5U26_12110 [Planctomycetota bacterium]|nr:hypothetical protein [Planctomycetota bacterium]
MSNKLMALLPQLVIGLLVGALACGALTFTLFSEWRKVSLVESAFNRAKDQDTKDKTVKALDELCVAPGRKDLAGYYQPLAQATDEYKTARDSANPDDIVAFFEAQLKPSLRIPWICFGG